MSLKQRTLKKYVIIAVGLIVILVVGFNLAKVVVPAIIEAKYKHQISDAYSRVFPPLDGYVKALSFSELHAIPASTSKPQVDCDNGPFSPSTPCGIYVSSDNLEVDAAFIKNWRAHAPALEKYLTSHGWQPSENLKETTLTKLIDSDANYQTFASYYKKDHGVGCSISAEYLSSDEHPTMSISEGCSKYTDVPHSLNELWRSWQ